MNESRSNHHTPRKMPSSVKRIMSIHTASTDSLTSRGSSPSGILRSEHSSTSLGTMKQVSFETVEINEHAIILGDNVVCDGPPLTIDWHAQCCTVLSLEDYERFRVPNRLRKMSADERFLVLAMNGIPIRSSLVAAKEAARARESRQETVDEINREQEKEIKSRRKERKIFRGIWSKLRAR